MLQMLPHQGNYLLLNSQISMEKIARIRTNGLTNLTEQLQPTNGKMDA